jgi:pyruvate formate lyase activating enzyme
LEKRVNIIRENSSKKLNVGYNPIYSITPFTLLDFPDITACILWFAGCNMRCVYCYNPDIVLGKGKISYEEVLKFLSTRKNLLEGVVLSGGECTMHKDLIPFAETINSEGFKIKIDTNGSRPDVIKALTERNLVQYVALDFKAPPGKFYEITKSDFFHEFQQTLRILISGKIPFEVRTTVHSGLLDKENIHQMIDILKEINYPGTFYLQNFLNNVPNLGNYNEYSEKLNAFQNTKLKIEIRN